MTQLGDQDTDDVDIDNVIAAIIDGRVYPDTTGLDLHYFCVVPDDPEDSYEVDTDIVAWLIENRWATTDDDHDLAATDLGKSEHGTTWFLLDILTAIHQGRAYRTTSGDRYDSAGRRLYVYDHADGDLFENREFSVDPLVHELGWVELDDDGTPHLTDAGAHRLELFGLLAPAE